MVRHKQSERLKWDGNFTTPHHQQNKPLGKRPLENLMCMTINSLKKQDTKD